jgi:CheY-like chemotaxis protein
MDQADRKRRILIIDDDEEFLSDLTILLSDYFHVEIACGTQEAMEKMRLSLPDCLLLDVEMRRYFGDDPDIEGYSFLQKLYGQILDNGMVKIPLVLVSSHDGRIPHSADQVYNIRARFSKPPDVNKLRRTITELTS